MLDSTPSASRPRSYNGGYMELGREAEEVVLAFLRGRPDILEIDDLRELRPMQKADVDCSIMTADGRVTLAEIKADRHLGVTPYVLFEALRVNHTAPPERAITLGWSARSPAAYFLYYAPSVGGIYQCRADDLRECVQVHTGRMRQRTRTSYVPTDRIKSTLNILLPWAECKDIFTIHNLEGNPCE